MFVHLCLCTLYQIWRLRSAFSLLYFYLNIFYFRQGAPPKCRSGPLHTFPHCCLHLRRLPLVLPLLVRVCFWAPSVIFFRSPLISTFIPSFQQTFDWVPHMPGALCAVLWTKPWRKQTQISTQGRGWNVYIGVIYSGAGMGLWFYTGWSRGEAINVLSGCLLNDFEVNIVAQACLLAIPHEAKQDLSWIVQYCSRIDREAPGAMIFVVMVLGPASVEIAMWAQHTQAPSKGLILSILK